MVCNCGKPISASAYQCPHCGARHTPLSTVLLGVGLPLLLILALWYSCTRPY